MKIIKTAAGNKINLSKKEWEDIGKKAGWNKQIVTTAAEIDGLNRWRIAVELTWDISDEDITTKYEGDSQEDFANRAFARVRPALQNLINEGPFDHFHILERPKPVLDI